MSDQDDTPGEEASRDVKSRMARRLGGDDQERSDRNAENEENAGRSMNEQSDTADTRKSSSENTMSAESSPKSENAWNAENVKDAWTGVTVYLPDHLREALDDEYRRLDYELGGEIGAEDLRKDRHYKPFVMALGMERLASMEEDELTERMERMMRHELPEEEE